MPITKQELKEQIEAAFDAEADVVVNPAEARARVAQKIADAIEAYVIDRTTTVTGTTSGGDTVTATGIIQTN